MAKYVDIEKAEYPYMSMSMWGVNSKDCKVYNEGVKATEDMIQALPTADVEEVKHGEWKMEYYETRSTRGRLIRNKTFTCSNCNRRNGRITTNYCSNCGAKMDLKGEIHNGL